MKKYFYQDFLHLNLKKITKIITSKCLYPYNALCWTCRNRRSTSLPLSGWSSGVLLTLSLKLMSAPLSNNSRATSVLLFRASKCNGVYLLNRVCLFTWAPSCNRCLMVSVRLDILQDEELSDQRHYSHPQAFHFATSDQPSWRHHQSLHQGSLPRVAHRFLGMKNDWMQIKTKQIDFCETHFQETYFSCVGTFVQLKNK